MGTVSDGEDGRFRALHLGSASPIVCPQARLGGSGWPGDSPPPGGELTTPRSNGAVSVPEL